MDDPLAREWHLEVHITLVLPMFLVVIQYTCALLLYRLIIVCNQLKQVVLVQLTEKVKRVRYESEVICAVPLQLGVLNRVLVRDIVLCRLIVLLDGYELRDLVCP